MADRFDATESFAELAMPQFARIYNFACWLTQNRGAAESLVQETYVKALNSASTYQSGTNFRAWIYRILRHTFLTTQTGLRASANTTAQAEGAIEQANGVGMQEKVLQAHIDQDRMRECLEELPMSLREVLLLCDVEEMTYKEMAQILGIPAGSVLARLNRARSTLRALLSAPRSVQAPAQAQAQPQAVAPPPEDDIPDMPEEIAHQDYYPETGEDLDESEEDPDESR